MKYAALTLECDYVFYTHVAAWHEGIILTFLFFFQATRYHLKYFENIFCRTVTF